VINLFCTLLVDFSFGIAFGLQFRVYNRINERLQKTQFGTEFCSSLLIQETPTSLNKSSRAMLQKINKNSYFRL
jgi:hypothetical protein